MSFFRRSSQRNSTVNGVPVDSSSEKSVCENVKCRLSNSIKDLQVAYGEGNPGVAIETNELTHGLVIALEALFIHGLKKHSTRAVKASSLRNLPGPSFWTFVLVFSHKETISHLEKLTAITTDIGKGRAWIRLAVNDGFLCSYLSAMASDKDSLEKHYNRNALLRDSETMDVFIRYLRGIEIYRFDIALNSGLLNRWATAPLILAGLVISENANEPSTPTATALDAASLIDNAEDAMAVSTPEAATGSQVLDPNASEAFEVINKPAGYLNRGLLNEDEALKLILAGVSPAAFSGSSSKADSPVAMPSSPVTKRKELLLSAKNNELEAAKTREMTAGQSSSSLVEKSTILESMFPQVIQSADEGPPQSISINPVLSAEVPDNTDEKDFSPEGQSYRGETEMEEDDEEDDDELIDIYARRRDSSSCDRDSNRDIFVTNNIETILSSQRAADEADQDDEETINTGLDSIAAAGSLACTAVGAVGDQMKQVTSYVTKRAGFGLSSSKSSGCDELIVASVPYLSLSGFIDSWHPFGSGRYFDTPPKGVDASLVQCGFSLKPHVQVGTLSEEDSQQLMLIFDQVVREEGLSVQNFECAECTRAIGTIFGPAKVCAYTRRYYCEECHSDETSTIPAKIMYNWDFRQFAVCHKAKLFLTAVSIEPIINVKSFNGELFEFAASLSQVFDLRRQLRYMNAYLATCADGKSQAKAAFTKLLWPRQHLYEDIDMYSIRDLEDVHSGKLVNMLAATVKFSLGHILKCILCSGKGFICEICRQDQVIFPFELDSIMQCKECYTVFHLDCSMKMTTCPKCDRIEARNLNWQVGLSKAQRLVMNVNDEDDDDIVV